MKHTVLLISVLLVLCLAVAPQLVSAHRIYVDVTSQTIVIEAYYGDGRPVKNGDVTVTRENGDVYLTGKTDGNGTFSFEIKDLGDETLAIEVEQTGHLSEVTIGPGGGSEEDLPLPHKAIAGIGYLVGIAGIAGLLISWRMKHAREEADKESKKE